MVGASVRGLFTLLVSYLGQGVNDKEQFDDDGMKTIIIECQYNKDHVKDFIKKVEDAIEASETDLEKERICRKYSGQEDYCLLKSGLLNHHMPKNKLDHSYINAMKAKGYYRGDN